MKLHFLGTGGGRKTLIEQSRKTAGTIIETEETAIYLDPGPGSITECQDYDTEKLRGLIVTHSHLDHYGGAEPIIELISFKHQNSCKLMAPESVLSGYSDINQSISDYHQNLCTEKVNLTKKDTEIGDLKIESQEMFHNEPKCRGLKISNGKKKIGFWTDTAYSEELIDFYSDCNTVIINCSMPHKMNSRKHTSLSEVPKILENLKAKTAIITHFGGEFLETNMEEEKNWLEEQVDQKVIFAEDGMTFPGDRKLSSF